MTIHECCLSSSLYYAIHYVLFIVDNLLQLFIGKEQTHKAFPRGAQINFFCTDIDSHWASRGNTCTFCVYWPTCVFPSVFQLKLKNERWTEKISMSTQWKYKSMKYVNFVISNDTFSWITTYNIKCMMNEYLNKSLWKVWDFWHDIIYKVQILLYSTHEH